MAQASLCVTIVPFLVELAIGYPIGEACDYCATFGRIGNRLPNREVCDYCATFGSIGDYRDMT